MAADLQKSGAATVTGRPYLTTFFRQLTTGDPDDQAAIAAWRAARPRSDLARVAEIDMWTNAAWRARGNGTAADITKTGGQTMSDALDKAAQAIDQLPASALSSPLTFVALQNWAQLSGIGREFQDAIFTEGTAKFPAYNTLYYQRIEFLMPRWYGAPGDVTAMIAARADQIGGIEGDMFYAMALAEGTSVMPISKDNPYDVTRANRGLAALRARHPDSITLRSAQLSLGFDEAFGTPQRLNWELAKAAFAEPNGNQLDATWGNFESPEYRVSYADDRMKTLAVEPPQPS